MRRSQKDSTVVRRPRAPGSLVPVVAALLVLPQAAGQAPWVRHAIESGRADLRGADGVRLGDIDGDGRPDIVTGWEESGVVRAYRHPGPQAVRDPWPAVTVGAAPSVEDACFVDFDGDGVLDVLSCCEGRTRRIFLHQAPGAGASWFEAAGWRRRELESGEQQWMFALPVPGGFVAGSKGAGASVTRFAVEDSQVVGRTRLADAGWIMSILAESGRSHVLVTDRNGERRGLHRLALDGAEAPRLLGAADVEVMFATTGDLDGDGIDEIVAATRNGRILVFRRPPDETPDAAWPVVEIPHPFGITAGKAVAVADLDLDGRADLVLTANTQRQPDAPGVVWLRQVPGDGGGDPAWEPRDVSGPEGDKFDLVEAIDLDGDGDLDLLTCEEAANLGVVWYENPVQ